MYDSSRQGWLYIALLCGVLCASSVTAADISLSVRGADDGLKNALRAASLSVAAEAEEGPTAQDLLTAARADYAQLLGVLYAMGYYSPVIRISVDGREAAEIPPFSTPARIRSVKLRVIPGPQFRFSQAKIAPLAPATKIPDGFASGKIAYSGTIRDAADAGVEGWRDTGHAKVVISGQDLVADHNTNTLGADIRLSPGPKLRFGRLTTSGKTRVRPERVRAIAGLPEGEVFSPEELRKSATRLRRTGTFRSVALIESDVVGSGNTLDIDAAVVDQKRRRLGFGAEISSLEGLTLSGFWLHRNLLGGAERLRIGAEVAGIGGDTGGQDLSLSARFDRPATFSPDTGLYVLGTVEERDEPEYFERTTWLGAGLTHIFSDHLTGEIGIALRHSQAEDDLGKRNFDHVFIPANLTWDGRDVPLDATKGAYLSVDADPFVGISDSTSGGRLYADGRIYRAFGADRKYVLAARGQFGTVLGADIDEIPPELLFFSGGGGTVRGQPYQSLAIDLNENDRIGGRSFAGLSVELRADIGRKIGLVGFYDTGFIGRDSALGGKGESHSGAGLGVRYDTGIGPIRLDVALPVSGDTGEGLQFYVGIGQAF